MEASLVDRLLERYLALLDEYTRLRSSLSSTQGDMFQNIARANFSAERGMRYGQDYYDDRMQALRTVDIVVDSRGVPSYSVIRGSQSGRQPAEQGGEKVEAPEQGAEGNATSEKPREKNPLHWYGILTPMPLRQAQTQAEIAVDNMIPRLLSVNAEMSYLEIEIRRARKKRGKAEGSGLGKGTASTVHEQPPVQSGAAAAT